MKQNPRIICKNGVSLSVQASQFHYCFPRQDTGPHTECEVGFIQDGDGNPLSPPESWREHGDGCFPSDVYGYVPKEKIMEFTEENGGIESGMFPY